MDVENAPLRLAGCDDIISQFSGSPLLKSGKLVVVSLEAIAERLGRRWSTRRDFVYEHAERALHKSPGPQALVQRVSETEFIVAQADLPRVSGQLCCLNCLRDILRFFVGAAAPLDVKVHTVTRITEEGLFGARLDPSEVEAAEAVEGAVAQQEGDRRTSLDRWTPFTISTGRRVVVSSALEPIFSLRNSARIGYRIAARVLHQPSFAAFTRQDFERLGAADLAKIDFATVARGIDRLRDTGDKPPALVVPLGHSTLQGRGGRATAIGLLRLAGEMVRHGVIAEITEVERVPPAMLQETVRALRPLSLRVVGRLTDPHITDNRTLRGAGLAGLAVLCPRFDGDGQYIEWVRALRKLSSGVSKTLLIYQVADMKRALWARECGVTHATLASQATNVPVLEN